MSWSAWLQSRLSALGEELADEAVIEYIDSIVQLEEVSHSYAQRRTLLQTLPLFNCLTQLHVFIAFSFFSPSPSRMMQKRLKGSRSFLQK